MAMINRSTCIIFLAAVVCLVPSFGVGIDTNVLITGDVLGTDAQLSNPAANLVMQGDCNLVLYNTLGNGFQSNTHGRGQNCTLTLNDYGQLIIRNGAGSTVWRTSSTPDTRKGVYAAVLRPDGQVAVYGSIVMHTPGPPPSSAQSHTATYLKSAAANNLLFSGEILSSNAQLSTRDYTFVMRDDCNLALVKGSTLTYWTTRTEGKGNHCFVRLSHRGQMAVVDDDLQVLWSNGGGPDEGEYVMVLEIDGKVAIYGPIVWSTASNAAAVIKLPSF